MHSKPLNVYFSNDEICINNKCINTNEIINNDILYKKVKEFIRLNPSAEYYKNHLLFKKSLNDNAPISDTNEQIKFKLEYFIDTI